ncbi:hypothetical protein SEA_KROMP_71 [Streptomyces phage Kromp]|uniref:Uncharacterized protein n=1 Tax=Streptomyces phage Kromp TaxID=2315619 RepID=A0A386KA68_9CAUD|nr:hypothetical protein SEA_KROMP_71 [Streptomyces phage Kromp]
MDPQRYHLVLLLDGRPTMRGWWADEAVARGKFTAWVGAYGKDGARITLTDEETGTVLTEWPDIG